MKRIVLKIPIQNSDKVENGLKKEIQIFREMDKIEETPIKVSSKLCVHSTFKTHCSMCKAEMQAELRVKENSRLNKISILRVAAELEIAKRCRTEDDSISEVGVNSRMNFKKSKTSGFELGGGVAEYG